MKIALASAAVLALLAPPAFGCPKFPPPEDRGMTGVAASTKLEGVHRVPPATRRTPVPDGPLASVKITLSRSGCLGSCPSYVVEIAGDGAVRYHGDGFVLVEGEHQTTLAPQDVRCLVDAFRAADFWSLSPGYLAPVTDNRTNTLTLSIGGQTRVVTDYVGRMVGMPKAVVGLEDAIDQVSGVRRWVDGDAETLAALEAEHFDFHGRAGANLLARAMFQVTERGGPARGDEVVRGLLSRRVRLDGRINYQGENTSAAEMAASNGRLDLLRLLVKAGLFESGDRAIASDVLRASASSQRPDLVSDVLQHDPDVNSRDRVGDTALLRITDGPTRISTLGKGQREEVAIIGLLLQAGADPNIANNEGKTVLHQVLEPDQARAFIAGGARLELRDRDGDTPLLAVFTAEVAIVLIEAGADPMVKARDGETFVQIARAKNWKRALAAIRARGERQAGHHG